MTEPPDPNDETEFAAGDEPTQAAPAQIVGTESTIGVGTTGRARAVAAKASAGSHPVGRARYRDGKLLGQGGMGRVFEAEDLQFGRVVAVKEMIGGGAEDRFGLEAVVTASLDHPGIPAIYERGSDNDGRPFYTMRLVRGRNLATAIGEAQTLDEKLRLMPVILDVANTIAFAHERGVIHRDIKPANVVVCAYGDTVVIDWGLAKLRGLSESVSTTVPDAVQERGNEGKTQHGTVLGTPSYMAPEQAAGRIDEVDERSDVFSIGALIYQLLSGRAPHGGRTGHERIANAIDGRPTPLAELAPDAPADLVRIVEKAMMRGPSDRYRNASELAKALQDFIARGLVPKESLRLRIFADVVSVAFLLLTLGMSVFVVAFTNLSDGGFSSYVMLATFLIGLVASTVEFRTNGRHHLSPLVIGMALVTLVEGVTFGVLGLVEIASILERVITEGEQPITELESIAVMSSGLRISMVPVVLGFQLSLAQFAVWLVLRRHVLRSGV